ncbi:Multidrug and toxin extrusion protein 1 [Lamellibrachia satsuma]|nr:Multidrug and toxin extrusion protein 1 [Lamellibrachia satsuma]
MPCIAIYLNTTSILLLIGQNPEVSRLAGRYLFIFIPGALSFFMYMILSKYLQTQVSRSHQPSRPVILADANTVVIVPRDVLLRNGARFTITFVLPCENIVIPSVIIGIVANSLNAGMHYVFLYQLHWGTDASALSQAVSYFVMFSLTLIYIRWSKIYEETWGGILGLTELGAMSVVVQVDGMVYVVLLGIQVAASILIGQKLGAQDKLGALTMARLVIVILVMVSLIPLTMYLVFRDQLPYIFTYIREVAELASKLFLIISIYVLFNGIVIAGKAILCGIGRQVYGVVLMVVCHTFIAMPIGIPLMFLTRLRTEAFWWAMVGSLILQAIVTMCIVKRIDWSLEVQEAMKRAAGKVEVFPNIDDHVTDHYENTTSITTTTQSVAVESSVGLNEQDDPSVEPELETTVDEKTLDRVGTNGEAVPKEDDNVTDHSENTTPSTNTTQSTAVDRTPDLNEDDDLTVETTPDLNEDDNVTVDTTPDLNEDDDLAVETTPDLNEDDDLTVETTPELNEDDDLTVETTPELNEDDDLTVETITLSTTQLMIRRGSISLLMSLILGGGIAGHLLIPVQSSTFLQSFTNTTTAIPFATVADARPHRAAPLLQPLDSTVRRHCCSRWTPPCGVTVAAARLHRAASLLQPLDSTVRRHCCRC